MVAIWQHAGSLSEADSGKLRRHRNDGAGARDRSSAQCVLRELPLPSYSALTYAPLRGASYLHQSLVVLGHPALPHEYVAASPSSTKTSPTSRPFALSGPQVRPKLQNHLPSVAAGHGHMTREKSKLPAPTKSRKRFAALSPRSRSVLQRASCVSGAMKPTRCIVLLFNAIVSPSITRTC